MLRLLNFAELAAVTASIAAALTALASQHEQELGQLGLAGLGLGQEARLRAHFPRHRLMCFDLGSHRHLIRCRASAAMTMLAHHW